MRRAPLLLTLAAVTAGPLSAQAVPERTQATRVAEGYRRTPSLRVDPFRHVMIPHWGFVFSAGARGENNSLNLRDIGSIILLDNDDELLVGDALDALGLVPRGKGLAGAAQGEGGFYLGGPLPGGLSIGFSAQGRGYGAFEIDDDAVALLRDGNGARQQFSLGDSRGAGLGSLEFGVHMTLRVGPVYSVDGPRITFGAGARQVRPIFYGKGSSVIANGGTIFASGDSLAANVEIESLHTPLEDVDAGTIMGERGSGLVGDFLVRLEWPTNGLALEAMVANLGTVTIEQVEQRIFDLDVATTVLDTVIQELEDAEFEVRDTLDVSVTLPRIVRFGASAWANRILQLDVSTTLPVGGDFPTVFSVDVGSTWRFIRTIPLRAGLTFGDRQGIGFTGGIAIEGRTMFLQIAGQSLGGLFRQATGLAGRFELGLFF